MPGHTPVWFITAASSGFGQHIALEALKRGHVVIATARNADRIQDLADAGAHTMALDVTASPAHLDAVAKQVFEQHARVDYLVNVAGYILEGAAEEVSPDEVYDSFNTNVFGVMKTVRAFLPHIRSQPVVGPDGTRSTVVTVGSLASWAGGASYSVYAMTKACVSSLAESLRDELAPFDIRATVVEPGYFRTSFLSPQSMVHSSTRIPAYSDTDTSAGQTRKRLLAVNGHQPGDVTKGSRVVVDVLTGTGVGEGKDLPARIVLGSDCEKTIRDKVSQTVAILDEWEQVIQSTDF